MEFIDRKPVTGKEGMRKITKVSSTGVALDEEEFYAKISYADGATGENEGTPLNAVTFSKGNWRDDKSLSFERSNNDNLPESHPTKTQIITKHNGEVWVVPPVGSNRIKIGEKGNKGDTGEKGDQGDTGEKGDKGDVGQGIEIKKFYSNSVAMEADLEVVNLFDIALVQSPQGAENEEYAKLYQCVESDGSRRWIFISDLNGIKGDPGTLIYQPNGNEVMAVNLTENHPPKERVVIVTKDYADKQYKELLARITLATKKSYGVKIDRTNSNPESAVEYTGAAIGLIPSKGNNGKFVEGHWDSAFPYSLIRPCLFKNGKVVEYLDPNDYSKSISGAVADITSGNAGDVMIEIPHFYYRIHQDDAFTYAEISDTKHEGFTDYAFSYNGQIKDRFYIGAYKGYIDGNGKLRSLSGVTPTANKTIVDFRTAAHANGAGYEQMSFNKWTALQVLYLQRFKNLNSQVALGKGYTINQTVHTTGATNHKGMNYGTESAEEQCKFSGIEDFFGNLYEWIDGFIADVKAVLISDGNFNDTGTGYSSIPYNYSNMGAHLRDVAGTNELGFIPRSVGGSDSTYYCDYGWLSQYRIPVSGGDFNGSAGCGVFYFHSHYWPTSAYPGFGSRLVFCG